MDQEFFNLLLENMTETVWLMDFEGRITFVSPAAEKVRGYAVEEVKAMGLERNLAPESLKLARGILGREFTAEHLADKAWRFSTTLELEFIHKEGSTVWRECTVTLVREKDGTPRCLLGVSRDMTRRRAMEASLKESESRLKMALEASEEGLWDLDLLSGAAFFSPRVYTMLGYQPQEFPASVDGWKGLIHPEDRALAMGALESIIKTGSHVKDMEFRLRAKNGSWRWVLGRGRVTQWAGEGKPARMSGTLLEITEKKLISEALKASESRYRNMFNNTYAMMLLVDPDSGEVVDANPAACLFYGYTRDRFKGRSMLEISLNTRQEVFEEFRDAISGRQKIFYTRHKMAGGEAKNLEIAFGPLETQGRRLLLGIIHDLSGRQRVEASLKEAEARFAAVFQASPEMIIVSTVPEGRILEVNEAYTRVSGFSREDVIGKLARDLNTWVDLPDRDRIMRQMQQQNRPISFESRFRGKGESIFNGYCSIAPCQWAGQPCLVWIALDITPRKQAEQALRESEERFRQVVDFSPSPIAVAEEGRFVYLNQNAVRILGAQAPEQVLGRKVLDVVHPDFREAVAERLAKIVLEEHENDPLKVKLLRLDGGEAYFESVSKVIPYNGKRAYLISGRDLTLERKLEEMMGEQQKKK